ncbi:MAG: Crp/Fnr family transcriptional regulator [Candidatus Pseudobacter hemicellulosilyticus]|uniref:Crp/Fnr family transcriptional regulator n=1 Tax=Candidatus Pseudobacter hemicellulosilyticus TaxID=3121375 RepID=A0AAJ5WU85_9BACT|nr:MAG: Crp/Fnr family transcriptional regulator [Pseudobacter sp.]
MSSLQPVPGLTGKPIRRSRMEALLAFIHNYQPISPEARAYVVSHMQECQLKKGELLQEAGNYCQYIYFVSKGILRGYILDSDKEVTTWITGENQLISSIRSFLLKQPTQENIEALEDCRLLALHAEDLQYLYDHFPEFNIVGRKIAEHYYTFAEDRAFIGRLSSASARYDYFFRYNAHLINRIPLMFIASYLGMSNETLSRIRSGLTKKKKGVEPGAGSGLA